MTFSPRWLPAFNRLEAASSGSRTPSGLRATSSNGSALPGSLWKMVGFLAVVVFIPIFALVLAEVDFDLSSSTPKGLMGTWTLRCLTMIPIYRCTKAEEYVAEREP